MNVCSTIKKQYFKINLDDLVFKDQYKPLINTILDKKIVPIESILKMLKGEAPPKIVDKSELIRENMFVANIKNMLRKADEFLLKNGLGDCPFQQNDGTKIECQDYEYDKVLENLNNADKFLAEHCLF